MSVGKGSIKRAAQAKEAVKEVKKEAVVVKEETKIEAAKAPAKKAAAKAPAKKAPAKAVTKKAPAKKSAVVATSVISSDDIHEKKFEAVSKIHCDLPIYLL